jgi:hypothetical protein
MKSKIKTGVPGANAQANLPDSAVNLTESACQWFLLEKKFCDKIKKEVRCDGNVGNCPF